MDTTGLLSGAGGFLEGLARGRAQKRSESLEDTRIQLERMRIEAAIDEARERLGMEREKHQMDMEMAREMRLRRSQSPYQLLQPQLFPLGAGVEGPLTPAQTQGQEGAEDVLSRMGPLSRVPLQDQEIFSAIRGFQQEADKAARMRQPLPGVFSQAYPGLPEGMTYQDFLLAQKGFLSAKDIYEQEMALQGKALAQQGKSAFGPEDILSYFIKYNQVRNDALEQGLPMVLTKYPEIQAQIEEASAMGPLNTNQVMRMLPYEALQELNDYASSQADQLWQLALAQGMDPSMVAMLMRLLSSGVQKKEVSAPNLEEFFEQHPGAVNLPLYQQPFIQQVLEKSWSPEIDLNQLIGELVEEAEGRGMDVGTLERPKKKPLFRGSELEARYPRR